MEQTKITPDMNAQMIINIVEKELLANRRLATDSKYSYKEVEK